MSIWDRFRRLPKPDPEPEHPEMDEWWDEEDHPVHHHEEMSGAELARRLLYDSGFKFAEDAMLASGFPKQSDDVSEMSRADSEARTMAVLPVAPLAMLMADLMATGLGTYALKVFGQEEDEDLDEEEIEYAMKMRRMDARATVLAVLSNLVDLGMISVDGLVAVVDPNE